MMKFNYYNAYLRICLDSLENDVAGGRVYGRRLSQPLQFGDLGRLLLRIDELLDAQGFPRAYQRKRSFAMEQSSVPCMEEFSGEFMDEQTVQENKGNIRTFNVNVIARQNTTWQGKIDWLDGDPPDTFSSELELVRLIKEKLAIKD